MAGPPTPLCLCLFSPQASVKPFVDDRAMRDKKRAIDKFVTLNVQQISATLEQVGLKRGRFGCQAGNAAAVGVVVADANETCVAQAGRCVA